MGLVLLHKAQFNRVVISKWRSNRPTHHRHYRSHKLTFETDNNPQLIISSTGPFNVCKAVSHSLQAAPATPSINFTGATTSGMYSPAATRLLWQTNGVERMAIDNNGAVTINTPAAAETGLTTLVR